MVRGEFRAAFDDHRRRWRPPVRPVTRRLEMLALRELGGHAGVAVSMAECAGFLGDGLRIAEKLGDRGIEARSRAGWRSSRATGCASSTRSTTPGRPSRRAGAGRTPRWRPGWTG